MQYFVDRQGSLYQGDMQHGDREATADEVAAWVFSHSAMSNNADIKAALAELDGKSIRTLHEAVLLLAASGTALPAETTKRLQDLETQKQELRSRLIS